MLWGQGQGGGPGGFGTGLYSLPKSRCLRALALHPSLLQSILGSEVFRSSVLRPSTCTGGRSLGEAGAWAGSQAEAEEKPGGSWASLWVSKESHSTDMLHSRGEGWCSSTVRASGTKGWPEEYLERAWVGVHPSAAEAGEPASPSDTGKSSSSHADVSATFQSHPVMAGGSGALTWLMLTG